MKVIGGRGRRVVHAYHEGGREEEERGVLLLRHGGTVCEGALACLAASARRGEVTQGVA